LGLGFPVPGCRFPCSGSDLGARGGGEGFGFRVSGFGFRVSGWRTWERVEVARGEAAAAATLDGGDGIGRGIEATYCSRRGRRRVSSRLPERTSVKSEGSRKQRLVESTYASGKVW
jgi:hypothetical protein